MKLLFLFLIMSFSLLYAEEVKQRDITWSSFVVQSKEMTLGISQEELENKLGKKYMLIDEGTHRILQYAYSSFGGKEPKINEIRVVRFTFHKSSDDEKFLMSEIAFSSFFIGVKSQ